MSANNIGDFNPLFDAYRAQVGAGWELTRQSQLKFPRR